MKNIILISILSLFGSCGSKSDTALSQNNKNQISSALISLTKNTGSDAFVIIEELGSGKFVQFSGNANEELYFSMPVSQLSKSELAKAKSLLKQYDINVENIEFFTDDSANTPAGSLNEFAKKIDHDVEKGVTLVSEVMTKVFGFKGDVKLLITEN